MKRYNPDVHHRRSIRLKGYDYSLPGRYFVTLNTQNRACLFGKIVKGKIILNVMGEIVFENWIQTPKIRTTVSLDEFVIMPDHLHGIIIIEETSTGVSRYAPSEEHSDTPMFRSPSRTLGAIIRGFKSSSTKAINQFREAPGIKLWQRDYYDHIIRNDKDLNRIRRYIQNNPREWDNH